MRKSEEALTINPLFVALTRAPMLFGVTFDYFGVSIILSLCGFILFSSLIYLVIFLPVHVFGVVACMIDPSIFKLLIKKLECLNIPNKKIWGCQSYEPY